MSEAAAPSAPAAPAAPSNGAAPAAPQTPSAPATAKPTGTPKPRSTDGRFSPKDGSVGVVEAKPESARQPGETKEEFRLRMRLKTRAGEEEVSFSEEDLRREIQQGRSYQRKVQELQKALAEREELEKLATSNPEEYLRKRGVDPDDFAKKRIGELINLEAMSEEQRAALQVQRERDELAAWKAKREEEAKALKKQVLTQKLKAQRIEKYTAALQATGVNLATDAEKAEMVYRMASTEARLAAEDGTHDYTPEELAQETLRTAKADGKFYLSSLSVPGLIAELGQERVQAILAHTIAEFEKAGGASVQAPPEPPPRETAEEKTSPYIDERELERRLRGR